MRVLRATGRSFPTAGSALVEAAVDQAWIELYEQGHTGSRAMLLARWRGLAYLRALNGVRERRRHPVSSVPVEELAQSEMHGEGGVFEEADALRAEARAQEILHQVSGDARRWLELVLDDPSVPPRMLARSLGWDREKLKSVARRARARLREFVDARASGAICERRQAVMRVFAASHLVRQDPGHAARLAERAVLGPALYEQVALHIAGCEECERAWRSAQNRLLRPRVVFIPAVLSGKLAVAGGAVLDTGRRALGRLDRLLWELRARIGSGAGRVSAGGAAGTAGAAGALAGKGAAVCVGVLCATGMGTAALVSLPTGIVASRTVAHHRGTVVHRGGHDRGASAAGTVGAITVGASNGQAASSAQSDPSSARAGESAQRSRAAAHTIGAPAHPVTPGDLVATSATAGPSKVESQPSAKSSEHERDGGSKRV